MKASAALGFVARQPELHRVNGEVDNTRKDTISLDIMPRKKTASAACINYSFCAKCLQGTFPMAANQLTGEPDGLAELD
jgi:hypothetical protein